MEYGKVKFFNEQKGFGFVLSDSGEEYFVHISDIKDGAVLKQDDEVSFDKEEGKKGLKAVNVEVLK